MSVRRAPRGTKKLSRMSQTRTNGPVGSSQRRGRMALTVAVNDVHRWCNREWKRAVGTCVDGIGRLDGCGDSEDRTEIEESDDGDGDDDDAEGSEAVRKFGRQSEIMAFMLLLSSAI